MWSSNGFGNNGHFQNNFSQDGFSASLFGGNPGQPLHGQQYFPQQADSTQFEDVNDEGSITSEFQPELGLFNDGAFMQNQFINASPQVRSMYPEFLSEYVDIPNRSLEIHNSSLADPSSIVCRTAFRYSSTTRPNPFPTSNTNKRKSRRIKSRTSKEARRTFGNTPCRHIRHCNHANNTC